jgi:predicted small secreted protein
MKPASIAALVAACLALSACSNEDIDYLTALAVGEDTYAAGSLRIAEIIEAEEPRYYETDETGPMGEVVAGGADCQPVFRVRICK